MKLKEIPANVTVLGSNDIKASSPLAIDDLLRQIPGFSTFRRSSSLVTAPAQDSEAQGVTLRGIGPGGASRALVLLDGIPLNDAFGGWIYWGEVPLEEIDRIEIVRGGSSSLWGNFALGGVVNIITRPPQDKMVKTKLSVGNHRTTDNDLGYTDKLGSLGVGLHGNFFHTGGWNIIEPKQRGPIDHNSSSEHTTFNGRLEYAAARNLSVFLRGSYYDESRNTGTPIRDSTANRGFITGGGSLTTPDGSDWRLQAFSRFTRFQERFSSVSENRTSETPRQFQEVPSTEVGGSLTWYRRLLTHHTLLAGSDFRLIDAQNNDTFFDAAGVANNYRASSGKQTFTGLFVQDLYSPTKRLQINLNMRADYYRNFDGRRVENPTGLPPTATQFQEHTKTILSPRLAFRYELLDGIAARGAGYQAFRAPTLSELYRPSSVEGLVLRENPNLGPEYLEGGELGLDLWRFFPLTARLTAYWNNLRNPIANVTSARDPLTDEDTERTRVNLGRARVRGIETDVEYRFTSSWSVTASYLYSEALITDSPMDRDLEGKRLTQVPWHAATVGVRYANPALIDVLAQARFVGKQYEDADNHDKLAGYYVVDLTLSRHFTIPAAGSELRGGQIFLAIQNILDRQYIVDRGGGIFKVGTPFLIHGGVRLEF